MSKFEVVELATTRLINYDKNAKIHTQSQIDSLAKAIKEFGFRVPVLVKPCEGDKEKYEIIAGHGRVMAAKQLGLETVPAHPVDDLNEQQIKALRIADNKLNESAWDKEVLAEEFGALEEYYQELTAVESEDLGISDIDFDNIESNEDREKEFKEQMVTCPKCEHSFTIKV